VWPQCGGTLTELAGHTEDAEEITDRTAVTPPPELLAG
jgi:hypothetical protein